MGHEASGFTSLSSPQNNLLSWYYRLYTSINQNTLGCMLFWKFGNQTLKTESKGVLKLKGIEAEMC